MAQPESIENLKKLPIEELKARKEAAVAERNQLLAVQRRATARVEALRRQVKGLVEYSEEQVAKIAEIQDPEKRKRVADLNELRKQAALVNLDTVELMLTSDMTKVLPPSVLERIDLNCLRAQFLATEYNLLNYYRFLRLIASVVQESEAPASKTAQPAAAETGRPALPQRPSTGPLGGSPAGPQRPGVPQRPIARPGLPAAPAARPGAPVARPVPGQGSPLGRTGPLQAQAHATPSVRASSPLAGRATTGQLTAPAAAEKADANVDEALAAEIRKYIKTEDGRKNIVTMVERYSELDNTVGRLRGPVLGQIGVEMVVAAPIIKQIAGKVYYLNRALAELGPLGEKMPFEFGVQDPGVAQMLGQIAAAPEVVDTAALKEPPKSDFSLSRALKSLFKT